MELCENQSNIFYESKPNDSNYELKPICIKNGPRITVQSNFLAIDHCIISLVFLMTMLVAFYRVNSMAYLFKDIVLLLKSLHWKNVDYYWRIVFIGSCFALFIILLPILLCLWLFLLGYRQYIHHMIKVS